MISHDLAKQLKDAGFPKGLTCDLPGHDHTTQWFDQSCRYHVPTLPELIDACGFGFGELKLHVSDSSKRWNAISGPDLGADEDISRWGNTPEEAVAQLWLALSPAP